MQSTHECLWLHESKWQWLRESSNGINFKWFDVIVRIIKWLHNPVMGPSHFCRVRVIYNFSSRVRAKSLIRKIKSNSSHKNCRVTSSHCFASSSQMEFHIFHMSFFAVKWLWLNISCSLSTIHSVGNIQGVQGVQWTPGNEGEN